MHDIYVHSSLAELGKLLQKCNTVYAVIFEGCKFRGFRCKLVEREILILEKEAVA